MFKIDEFTPITQSINWKELPCTRLSLPLYSGNVVKFSDVVQGDIGSCWFLSALISYLRPNSKNLQERSNDLMKSIEIHKTLKDRTIYKITLAGKKIYVDDYVPLSYHSKSRNCKCMWFILFEKAMLSLMTYLKDPAEDVFKIYSRDLWVLDISIRCGEMKAATLGIGYVVGSKTKYHALHKCDSKNDLSHITSLEIYRRFKKGEHILANTSRVTYPGKKFPNEESVHSAGGIVSHCYAVIDMTYDQKAQTYMLTLCNPWGKDELSEDKNKYIYPPGVSSGSGISIISWERFHHLFACVHTSE